MKVLRQAKVATMRDEHGYGLLEDAALVLDRGTIAWVGPRNDLPPECADAEHVSLDGRLVTPALIDCHTHLVFGGDRAREFEMRLEGASYEDIARAGGGIASTVEATRNTPEDALLSAALKRADSLMGEGVAVVEIKSGYGLDAETELKMLRVARAVESSRAIRVRTSFLGAHSAPAGGNANEYIDEVCIPTLKKAQQLKLVDAVDGFCETIAFTPDQIARVFDAAKMLNLPVKLHAEQLSHLGGTALAASYDALSIDHVEYANDSDARAMAKSGSVAVLLPGAFFTLRETQAPPVDSFRNHGVPMAVATDWNPGSSPLGSLLLAMNMASTLFGLTPSESLAGTTRNAAKALGLDDCGQIAAGMRADLCVWDVNSPAELSYRIGQNPLHKRIFGGEL